MRRGPLSNSILATAVLLAAVPARAHDVITTKLTWNREISRMVYKRCASCHHDGGVAMSLTTYDDARPWAKAIRDQVVARTMPPWGAVKGVGSFRDDPSLTEVEIQMFVAWVEGGAPKGDDDSIAPGAASIKVEESKPRKLKSAFPAKTEAVAGELRLDHAILVQGIRPESLGDSQSMLVDAWFPDGRVEHLIWLRNYRQKWTRDYLFRTPLKLPPGTTVHVRAPSPAKALLLF